MEEQANTQIKKVDVALVKAVYHFNYLTSFPMPDTMLEFWANSINELEPELTPDVVKWIADRMKTGHIQYDHRLGIQNVFNGFRVYLNFKIKEATQATPIDMKSRDKFSALYKKYQTPHFTPSLTGIIA